MIQVFSKRTDKPKQYGYGEFGPVYTPVEYATSSNGVNWTSCYDVANLKDVFCYYAPDVPPAKRTDNTKKIGFQDGSRLMSTTYDSRQLTINLQYSGI